MYVLYLSVISDKTMHTVLNYVAHMLNLPFNVNRFPTGEYENYHSNDCRLHT